jgi:hypothetical protein
VLVVLRFVSAVVNGGDSEETFFPRENAEFFRYEQQVVFRGPMFLF